MAHQLKKMQGRSYTVERESHVVDENEPDIRVRSSIATSAPLEIKVAESWTVKELEEALVDQLCGKYLRSSDARHGILLIVYQNPRPRGWNNPRDGRRMIFGEVIEFLRTRCREIASTDTDAPQPEIAVIDVTTCGPARKRSERKRKEV